MKISSASKKVLASALSAAMVVAFAPTVAFAKAGDPIKVTIDANGGVIEGADSTFASAVQGGTVTMPVYKKDGYAASWAYDANNDGVIGKTEGNLTLTNGTLTMPTDRDAVTLKAFYSVPSIQGPATLNESAKTLTFNLSNASSALGDKLTVNLYGANGNRIAYKEYNSISSLDSQAFTFSDTADEDDAKPAASEFKAGTFRVTLVDGKDNVVASKNVTVSTLTLKDGSASTDHLAVSGSAYSLGNDVYTADGFAYTGSEYVVSGDATLTKAKADASAVYGGAYTASTADKQAGSMSFKVKTAKSGALYKLSVADKDGVVFEKAVDYASSNSSVQTVTVDFNAGKSNSASAAEKAGTYTATLTETVKGTEGNADEVKTSKAKITLTEVKYDANGGEFSDNADNTSKNDVFTASTDTAFTLDSTDFTTSGDKKTVKAPKGKEFAYWTLNGAALSNTNKLKLGEVNTVSANWKDEAASTSVAKPTIESAVKNADNTTYTVKLASATAGAKLYYSKTTELNASNYTTSGTAYNATTGITDVAADDTIYAIAVPVAGETAATLTGVGAATFAAPSQTAWKAAIQNGTLEYYVGLSTSKWSDAEGVKAAISAGNTAIAAVPFATEKDATDLVKAQMKALSEAVLAEAKAELAKYEGGAYVAVGTKVYTVADKDLKTANEAIATKEAYIAGLGEKKVTAAQYQGAIDAYVSAANKALKSATDTKLAAADVEAASAVTASLKAAKDADAAKAALEAYNKLTDDQKKLVATADVAAAQKVVSDAEAKAALVNAQDLAAARDLNGKKVTAKAKVGKKAQGKSFAYKLAASESGATASYAKVSGSKYIKISANGKVTFSKVKVAKKAKTYKAKVSVTYGTQTVTKTVQLVVKKK